MKKFILSVCIIAAVFAATAQQPAAKAKKKPAVTAKKPAAKTPAKMELNKEYTTASGLKYKLTQQGNGTKATTGTKVKVHYTGTLTDGKKFDSSRDRGQPLELTLGRGQVIKGWEEGIALLKVGDRAILTIPPSLGYGASGAGEVIPPNATLIFDVEIMEVKEGVKPWKLPNTQKQATASGLQYIMVEASKNPQAPKAENGSTVSVHYTGFLDGEKIFDSSIERGNPITFNLGEGRVIKGWEEGIALMRVGDKMRLIIPPHLGYGPNGAGGVIPPNATLYFDVELVNVKTPTRPWDLSGIKTDTLTTPSGLKYIVVEKSKNTDAPKAENGKTVEVHYIGFLDNGKVFDNSIDRGNPISFQLGIGQVIKGWDEGIGLMQVGDKFRLIIPSELGYGANGNAGIPPNATLYFDVELKDVR